MEEQWRRQGLGVGRPGRNGGGVGKEVLGEGREEVGRMRVDAVTEPEGSGLTGIPGGN